MGYWIRVTDRVKMKDTRNKNKKTSIKDSEDILIGRNQKIYKEIKLLDSPPKEFAAACERAGIPPTRRQYSKFLRKRGLAFRNAA